MHMDDLKKNAEGYSDYTAYLAIKNLEKDEDRIKKLLGTIFYVCGLAGYKVQGRIVLIDKKSGKVWR
jgi:hypothetical protein